MENTTTDLWPHLHVTGEGLPELGLASVQPVSLARNLLGPQAVPDAPHGLLDDVLLAPVRHVDLVHVEDPPDEEDGDGHQHQAGWDPECEGVAVVLAQAGHVGPDDRRDDHGEEAAQVDGPVEDGEEKLGLSLLFRHLELVPTESGHTGLDASRPEAHHAQTDEEESPGGHK